MAEIFSVKKTDALTPKQREILNGKRICIAGCGGLGCYAAEYLLRLKPGGIIVADGDVFDESNLTRQLYCTENTIGFSKVLSAMIRAEAVAPELDFRGVLQFIDSDNADKILAGCHIVIDALDSVESRRELFSACGRLGLTVVHGAVSGWCYQVAVISPGMSAEAICSDWAQSDNAPSFVPPCCAGVQVAETIKLLTEGKSELEGKLLCVDMLRDESTVIDL